MTDQAKQRADKDSRPKAGPAHSVDQHEIENDGAEPDTGDEADALRKSGQLPLETGNQYSHHKPEKN